MTVGVMGRGFRLKYGHLLAAAAATDRIARRKRPVSPAASVLFAALTLASVSAPAKAEVAATPATASPFRFVAATPYALNHQDAGGEPSQWTMMAIGFGLIGLARRRRTPPVVTD